MDTAISNNQRHSSMLHESVNKCIFEEPYNKELLYVPIIYIYPNIGKLF